MKPKLFVFIGKPGAGKSTIIRKLFPRREVVDVAPFVLKTKRRGAVSDSNSLRGYRNMYQEFWKKKTIRALEIGTGFPAFNVRQLKKMTAKFDITVFLLDVSSAIALTRVKRRATLFDTEALQRRLTRRFPEKHKLFLDNIGLPNRVIQTDRPLSITIQAFKKMIA